MLLTSCYHRRASRRLKTEFMVQLDGAGSGAEDRIVIMGATNRPQELDDAVLRRLVKRVYIPLPDTEARLYLIQRLLKTVPSDPGCEETIATATDGYSGSDLAALCREAAWEPIRSLGSALRDIDEGDVRPVAQSDFEAAMRVIRPSVSPGDLRGYEEWNKLFGASG